MKKIIVMMLVSAAALVAMASTAGALSSGAVNIGGSGGRHIGCTGNDAWNTAVCLDDPVPASSFINN